MCRVIAAAILLVAGFGFSRLQLDVHYVSVCPVLRAWPVASEDDPARLNHLERPWLLLPLATYSVTSKAAAGCR